MNARSGLHIFPVVSLILLFLPACGEDVTTVVDSSPRVKYFVVGEQARGQSRRISGKLVAADTSPLSFGVAGTVEQVLVTQGDHVAEGQLLAALDDEPLTLAVEQARAQLTISRARLAETRQIFERTVNLYEQGASSQAEVDTATAKHKAARGNLRAAQSDLARRERDLQQAQLNAPFAGTIAERAVQAFQEIAADEAAFVLQSADALEVDVRVPETMIRDVDYGQGVQVSFPSLKDVSLHGRVRKIASRAETGNAFPVSIRLPSTGADLRPGMTASVTFNFDRYLDGRTAYLIPIAALAIDYGMVRRARQDTENEAPQRVPVFVVNEAQQIEVRDVLIGDLRGNQLEVFAGLAAGDKVISAGVSFLRAGMSVELWTAERGLGDG